MGYTASVSWNPNIETFKGFFWKCKVHCTNLSLAKEEHLKQIWPGRIKNLRKAKFLFVLYCICKYDCSVLKLCSSDQEGAKSSGDPNKGKGDWWKLVSTVVRERWQQWQTCICHSEPSKTLWIHIYISMSALINGIVCQTSKPQLATPFDQRVAKFPVLQQIWIFFGGTCFGSKDLPILSLCLTLL